VELLGVDLLGVELLGMELLGRFRFGLKPGIRRTCPNLGPANLERDITHSGSVQQPLMPIISAGRCVK
jgi:hypothetical protein